MEEYNGISVTSRKPVIFSMDVTAMFPPLKHREVARIYREEFLKAYLKVDVDVIVLYLAIQYQDRRKELEDLFHHVETVATMEQERLDFLNEQFGFVHFKNWIF